jgi:hypothetical protein
MLKHGKANPLNIFGIRQLNHCPPHFEQVQFDLHTSEKNVTDWLYENLEGRFYLGQIDVKQPDSRPTFRQTIVAFEYPSEATYFSIFLSQINQSKFD